jgi:hypothetical protein
MWEGKKNGRRDRLWKVTCLVDASSEVAAAWWYSVCGRQRMKKSRESGERSRIILNEKGACEVTHAIYMGLGRTMLAREFVNRSIYCADEQGRLLIASIPCDEDVDVDWGFNASALRGSYTSIFIAEKDGEEEGNEQCRVTIVGRLNVEGWASFFPKLEERLRDNTFFPVADLLAEFQRDEEMDELDREKLLPVLLNQEQEYSQEEVTCVDKAISLHRDMRGGNDQFYVLPSSDAQIWVGISKESRGNKTHIKTTAVVDASVATCAAHFLFHKKSRQFVEESNIVDDGSFAVEKKVNDHCFYVNSLDVVAFPALRMREVLHKMIWKWDDEERSSLSIVCESVPEHPDFPLKKNAVRVDSNCLITMEELPRIGETPQTIVTVTEISSEGFKRFSSKNIAHHVAYTWRDQISGMRLLYDQSLTLDSAKRLEIIRIIDREHRGSSISVEEEEIVAKGSGNFQAFGRMKSKVLKMPSSLTKAKLAEEIGTNLLWGWASTFVRAESKEVLAHILLAGNARTRLTNAVDSRVQQLSTHSQVVYSCLSMPSFLFDRDFVNTGVWMETSAGEYVYVLTPAESVGDFKVVNGAVRGKMECSLKLSATSSGETKVDYLVKLDIGSSVPRFLMKDVIVPMLQYVTSMQEYFQEYRVLEEYDFWDGKAIGEALSIKAGEENFSHGGGTKVRVSNILKKHAGMREVGSFHVFFEPMLERVVQNSLRAPA